MATRRDRQVLGIRSIDKVGGVAGQGRPSTRNQSISSSIGTTVFHQIWASPGDLLESKEGTDYRLG